MDWSIIATECLAPGPNMSQLLSSNARLILESAHSLLHGRIDGSSSHLKEALKDQMTFMKRFGGGCEDEPRSLHITKDTHDKCTASLHGRSGSKHNTELFPLSSQ